MTRLDFKDFLQFKLAPTEGGMTAILVDIRASCTCDKAGTPCHGLGIPGCRSGF